MMKKALISLGLMSLAMATPLLAKDKPVQMAAVTPQARAQTPQLQAPAPEAMVIMIRSSLAALNQANQTNNYSVMNGLGSTSFRSVNPPDRLSQLFAPFRANNIDLAPIMYINPQLSQQAQVNNGKLRLVGFFPTQPLRVDYDLTFEPENGFWRLQGISVNLNQAVAQQQQPAAPVQR